MNTDFRVTLFSPRPATWHRHTGVRELEETLGLKAPSLYNRFGSKEALFQRVLARYIDTVVRFRIEHYLEASDPLWGALPDSRIPADRAREPSPRPQCLRRCEADHRHAPRSKGVNPTGESVVNNSRAVFLYVGSGSNWSQNAFIKASNTDAEDRFGSALSMDRDTLAVGAPGEASAGSSEQDNGAPNAGAVYAFARTSGIWSQQAFLKTQNPKAGDRFGASVSLLGEVMAVGAPGVDAGAGRVYLLRRFGAVWSHQTLMEAARRDDNDSFGAAVAISEDRIVVSATGEGSSARGVMATLVEQADNIAPGSGAVYSFARP